MLLPLDSVIPMDPFQREVLCDPMHQRIAGGIWGDTARHSPVLSGFFEPPVIEGKVPELLKRSRNWV